MSTTPHYPIVIVGAGLTGLCMAHALKNTPYQIALLEAQATPLLTAAPFKPLSINAASQAWLNTLGLWPSLALEAHPITQLHISEQGCFGAVRIPARPPYDALGYVLNAQTFQNTLYDVTRTQANLTIKQPAILECIESEKDQIRLTLNNGEQCTTTLLIAADGVNSRVRSCAGIAITTHPHTQVAFSARVKTTSTETGTAYKRFTQNTTFGLLPIGGEDYALVWTVPEALATEWEQHTPDAWLKTLRGAMGHRLGQITDITPPHIIRFKDQVAQETIRPHMVLLGNASQSLHPTAAQGFNTSLYEITVLANLIENASTTVQSLADPALLKHFAAQTATRRQQTRQFTHAIVSLFSSKDPLSKGLRRLGLAALSQCEIAQTYLAHFGTGAWLSTQLADH